MTALETGTHGGIVSVRSFNSWSAFVWPANNLLAKCLDYGSPKGFGKRPETDIHGGGHRTRVLAAKI